MAVIVNQSGFEVVPLPGRLDYPRHSLTVVAKATFELQLDAPATLADEQQPIGADIYDGDPATGSLRYESDLVHLKPQADVILLANAYAPKGQPTQRCKVTLGVGRLRRTLYVTGNRHWTAGLLKRGVSDPEPFSSMPLDWAHAFGGEGVPENPLGKGYRPGLFKGGGEPQPLPNIEDPDHVVTAPSSKPAPVGFAPVSRMWKPRVSLMGSYDEKWSNTRSPWFPSDMDWEVSQAAAPGLRVKGYLSGDEEIYLENLHPEHAKFTSQLPGIAPRCFIHEWPDGANRKPEVLDTSAWLDAWDRGPFRELPLNLDTLWVDAETNVLVLVWRGNVEVSSDEYEDIQHLYLTAEPLTDPSSIEESRERLLRELREASGIDTASTPEPEEAAAAPAPPAIPEKPDPEIAAAEAGLKASLASIPLAPGVMLALDDGIMQPPGESFAAPPETGEPASKVEARALAAFTALGVDIEDPEEAKPEPEALEEEEEAAFKGPWTRERVEMRLKMKGSLAGQDLQGLDLSKLDFSGADLERALLSGATLTRSIFQRARMNGADLSEAEIEDGDFAAAQASEARFGGAKLNRASLDSIVAERADFTGAELKQASMKGAQLRRAYLTDCKLSGANLGAADLCDADLTGASGETFEMIGADLSGCDASGSSFPKGNFREIVGFGSIWEEASLEEADFSYADLRESNFCKAVLNGADLQAVDLRRANLRKASLQGTRATRANLFHANAEYADLRDTDLSGSNLYGAEFSDARLDGVKLERANIRKTKLQELRSPR